MLYQCKQLLFVVRTYIIVKEWSECGEFNDIKKVVIVGDKMWAMVVRLSLFKAPIKIYYCNKSTFEKKYRGKRQIKWVIMDRQVKRSIEKNETNILKFPAL